MTDITLAQAEAVISGTLDAASEAGAKPLTVVVLDRAGHVVAVKRQDGATMFRYDVALGKAWGAAAFQQSSRTLAKKAADNPNFLQALAVTCKGRLLPNPGGLPIFNSDGVAIGAVGVSGDSGARDESFAIQGIRQAGLSESASGE